MNQDEWKSGRVDDVVVFVIDSDITGHSVMLLLNIRNPPLAEQAAGLRYRCLCQYIRGQKSTS
jgi:hypothetical protein